MRRKRPERDLLAAFTCEVAACGHVIRESEWGPALVVRDDPSGPVRTYLPFSKVTATLFETFAALPLTEDAIR